MRKTRHVVLPVRSWQYIGLLIVSLACLTLGHVSRDREGRHGSLAGPELMHTAPHEVDACPNQICPEYLWSTASSLSRSKLAHIRSDVRVSTSRDYDSNRNRDRSDITRLIANQNREHHSEEKRARYQLAKRRLSDEAHERRFRSLVSRDSPVRMQNSDQASMPISRIDRENQSRRGPFRDRDDIRFRTLSREHTREKMHDFTNAVRQDYRIQYRFVPEEHRTRIFEDQMNTKRQRNVRSERYHEREIMKRRNINHIKHSRTGDAFHVDADENLFNVQTKRQTRTPISEQREFKESKNRRFQEFIQEHRIRDLQSERALLSEQLRVQATANQLDSRKQKQSLEVKQTPSSDHRIIPGTNSERQIRKLKNEKRSITEESRIRINGNRHILRLEKKPSSLEKVRTMQSQRIKIGNGENRAQNVQNERRLVSEERSVRSDENRLYSRVEKRLPSVKRLRMIEKRQIRIFEDKSRVPNVQNERRLVSEERKVRSKESRLYSRVERVPSPQRVRIIQNRQVQISEKVPPIRSLQYDLKLVRIEPRVRTAKNKNRLIYPENRVSPNVEQVLKLKNLQISDTRGESQVRDSHNERRLGEEQRMRILDNRYERRLNSELNREQAAENRIQSRAQRALSRVQRFRMIENRKMAVAAKKRRVRNSQNELRSTVDEQRLRTAINRLNYGLNQKITDAERVRTIEKRQNRISEEEHRVRNLQKERGVFSEKRMRVANSRLDSQAEKRLLGSERIRISKLQGDRDSQSEQRISDSRIDRTSATERSFMSRNRNDVSSHSSTSIPSVPLTRHLKRDNHITLEHLDTSQVNGKKLDQLRRNSRVQKGTEFATINNKQLKDITMAMINTQYLKPVISDINLNYMYSILQQAIIIVFCAAYGASIFNKKTGPFRNFAQFTTRLLVW